MLGGLALRVVKVGGDGDDGRADGRTEIGLGVGFGFLQDLGANLLGGVDFPVDFHARHVIFPGHNVVGDFFHGVFDHGVVHFATHETFDTVNGIFGVEDHLVFGHISP